MRRIVDGEDRSALYAATARRARVEGPGVWLEPLDTLEAWAAQPEEAQDQAAQEVARRLGSGWALRGMRERWCRNGPGESDECDECEGGEIFSDDDSPCEGCDGTGRRIYYDSIIHRLALFTHVATGAEFSLVPGGFSEVPLETTLSASLWREVAIRPLLVARWPVTVLQGERGDGHDTAPEIAEAHLPQVNWSHEDCVAWCAGHRLRLPSAAEWRRAARGGAPTRFPWGDEVDDDYVWHAGNSGLPTIATDATIEMETPGGAQTGELVYVRPAGTLTTNALEGRVVGYQTPETGLVVPQQSLRPRPHPPAEHDGAGRWNAFGLVDCYGNVQEWTADEATPSWWTEEQRARPGRRSAGHRVMGGGYSTPRDQIGEPHRGVGSVAWIGFRPVADVPGLGAE